MKSRRATCLSTEERRNSVQLTWNDSTWNCTRCWPSRHPTTAIGVHHVPSRKPKSKRSSAGKRLEREARGYHRHRVALLTESVTHPERVQKVRGPPTSILSMRKQFEIVFNVADQQKLDGRRERQRNETYNAEGDPGSSRFCSRNTAPSLKFGDYMLQQSRQRADVFCGRCVSSDRETLAMSRRVRTQNTSTTTMATTPVPTDVSHMSFERLEKRKWRSGE